MLATFWPFPLKGPETGSKWAPDYGNITVEEKEFATVVGINGKYVIYRCTYYAYTPRSFDGAVRFLSIRDFYSMHEEILE